MRSLKQIICKCLLYTLLLGVLTVLLPTITAAASVSAEPSPSASYDVKKLDATCTGTATTMEYSGSPGETKQLGVFIGVKAENLPAVFIKSNAKYIICYFSPMPVSFDSHLLNDMQEKASTDDMMGTVDYISNGIGGPSGYSWAYIGIFIFNDEKELIGCLTNNSPVAAADDRQPYSVELAAYQFMIIDQQIQQSPAESESPGVSSDSETVADTQPSATTSPLQASPSAPSVAPAPAAEPGKKENSSALGTVTGVAAAAVVVLAAGGAGFLALNAAEIKEVVLMAAVAAAPGGTGAAAGASSVSKLKYPFIYLRLRKYSLLLGLKNEDRIGKLLKKQKLLFKSGSKTVMDLGGALDDETYESYKIRHPKKAMNGKKDVTIAYMNSETIIGQDHFDSKDDFVNIKYIETQRAE
jgi:hypothetical protein